MSFYNNYNLNVRNEINDTTVSDIIKKYLDTISSTETISKINILKPNFVLSDDQINKIFKNNEIHNILKIDNYTESKDIPDNLNYYKISKKPIFDQLIKKIENFENTNFNDTTPKELSADVKELQLPTKI